MTTIRLHQNDCIQLLPKLGQYDMLFADPPDNIGLKYESHVDKMPDDEYVDWFKKFLCIAVCHAPIVWVSFNAKWQLQFAGVFQSVMQWKSDWEFKPCTQTFTFGQHNSHDLSNCHRPLWRLKQKDAPLYPDQILVESERQKMGDKRANPIGKVPGDVFNFPRVVGNSAERRSWHPTQLNQKLVERCVLLSTPPGGSVIDPFAGTGTTLRVCERLGRPCDSIEIDPSYCDLLAVDLDLVPQTLGEWRGHTILSPSTWEKHV